MLNPILLTGCRRKDKCYKPPYWLIADRDTLIQPVSPIENADLPLHVIGGPRADRKSIQRDFLPSDGGHCRGTSGEIDLCSLQYSTYLPKLFFRFRFNWFTFLWIYSYAVYIHCFYLEQHTVRTHTELIDYAGTVSSVISVYF